MHTQENDLLLPDTDVMNRVKADFIEMPGLQVTRAQAQRLWALDGDTCDRVLERLVRSRFLRRSVARPPSFLRA